MGWPLSATRSEKLQKLQNRAVRVITSQVMTRVLGIYSLGWNSLSIRKANQKAVIMYIMYKEVLISSLQFIFTTCLLRELLDMIFGMLLINYHCQSQELIFLSVALYN